MLKEDMAFQEMPPQLSPCFLTWLPVWAPRGWKGGRRGKGSPRILSLSPSSALAAGEGAGHAGPGGNSHQLCHLCQPHRSGRKGRRGHTPDASVQFLRFPREFGALTGACKTGAAHCEAELRNSSP